jgi:hydrogenase nickel incorporation protein HypB
MCEKCGCEEKRIIVNKSITEENDIIAEMNANFLNKKKILCVNMMGAPDCGKTTVIESIAKHIDPKELTIIQGNLESDIDKKRIEKRRITTYQINTHSGCHLNSQMVNSALAKLDLEGKKYILVENVGNLVCPAGVKIGQHINMVVSSTTEGSDKPKKYPIIFLDADAVVISKHDLIKYVDFDEKEYVNMIKKINAKAKIIYTSIHDLGSFNEIANFIEHEREHLIGAHSH